MREEGIAAIVHPDTTGEARGAEQGARVSRFQVGMPPRIEGAWDFYWRSADPWPEGFSHFAQIRVPSPLQEIKDRAVVAVIANPGNRGNTRLRSA